MQITPIGGAVAKGAHTDAVGALVLEGQRGARRNPQRGPQIASYPWHDVELHRAVEGNRAALVVAGRLAEHLGRQAPHLGAAHEVHDERITVVGRDRVVQPQVHETADHRSLLPFDREPAWVLSTQRPVQLAAHN